MFAVYIVGIGPTGCCRNFFEFLNQSVDPIVNNPPTDYTVENQVMEVRMEFKPYDHWSGTTRMKRMLQLASDLKTLGFKPNVVSGCLNLVAFMIIYNPGAKAYVDAATSPSQFYAKLMIFSAG